MEKGKNILNEEYLCFLGLENEQMLDERGWKMKIECHPWELGGRI